MFYYEEENRRTGKWAGAVAVAAYLAMWVAVMLLVTFSFERAEEPGGGVMIDFGSVAVASGEGDPAPGEQQTGAPEQSSDGDAVLTQDTEDAPEVAPNDNDRQNTPAATEPVRQVNPNALFPGRTEGSTSAGEGSAAGAGNQGDPTGTPGGSHEGTGTGSEGHDFSLAGRSVVEEPSLPACGANKSGRVVIDITVDATGTVALSRYRAQGSTTNDSELVNAAIAAARKWRFNTIDGDAMQTGTITYNFILK